MAAKHKKIVIGLDQSYTRTGISVGVDGKLKLVSSTDYKGLESRSQKRKEVSRILTRLLKQATQQASEVVVICERIRTFSNDGNNKKGGFSGLKPDYIKMTGALVGSIVDTAAEFNVEVFSVDTRSWKSKIVGNSKAKIVNGKRDAKSETVNFVQSLGFDLFIREKKVGKNKGEKLYNDDAADSACICLYGFLPKSKQSLKLEE
jgi:hypothetical protein